MSTTRPEPDDITNYIEFGDVARGRCRMQCQYASRYLDGGCGSPDLGSDLRWYGSTSDYHFIMIHKDDADTFVGRMRERMIKDYVGWSGEPGPLVDCPNCILGQMRVYDSHSALYDMKQCPKCKGTGRVDHATALRIEYA